MENIVLCITFAKMAHFINVCFTNINVFITMLFLTVPSQDSLIANINTPKVCKLKITDIN